MNSPDGKLFRSEVLRARTDRLHGNINIATPVAWQLISGILFAGVVVLVGFLAFASYARTETVAGIITLDKGTPAIVASRSGIVTNIRVKEGQHVRVGQQLATIQAADALSSDSTAPDRIRKSLNEQSLRLNEQQQLLLQASAADRARLEAQLKGIQMELPSIEAQIADQQDLLGTAERDYRDAVVVAKRGFISKRDVDSRQATYLSRRQQLAQLQQGLSSKRAEATQIERSIAQSSASARAQAAAAQSEEAGLSQQEAQADLAQGYVLKAPFDGIVTAITARAGQAVTAEQQLMLVLPKDAQTRVELYVPTTSAGFLATGQEVRISVDAFPYQTFGTLPSRVDTISGAAIMRQGTNGTTPVYLATATLDRPWVAAFGKQQPLLPGMTLTARIVTQKRTLLEQLFAPVFAVRDR